MVDWHLNTDHLRSTPSFFNKGSRYDCVVFKDGTPRGECLFGKLRLVFITQVAQVDYPVALIEVLDVVHHGACPIFDCDLGLCHVRSWGRNAEPLWLIPAQRIVWGALIVKDHGCEIGDEYFVVDVVDSDMFLRCKHHVPYWYT